MVCGITEEEDLGQINWDRLTVVVKKVLEFISKQESPAKSTEHSGLIGAKFRSGTGLTRHSEAERKMNVSISVF